MGKKQYPIGKFEKPEVITQELISHWIAVIQSFPKQLTKEVENLSEEQLDTPYRQDGWTVRQVVHHCADSHLNAFCRIKLALTEDHPTIKPYYKKNGLNFPTVKNSLWMPPWCY